jgi:alcohol dehydrogenase class IV
MAKESQADIILSVGGGSPIDAAKAVAFSLHQGSGRWIPNIAIPTTLSVAETTQIAGYTDNDGNKVALNHPELVPKGLSATSLSASTFRQCMADLFERRL